MWGSLVRGPCALRELIATRKVIYLADAHNAHPPFAFMVLRNDYINREIYITNAQALLNRKLQ